MNKETYQNLLETLSKQEKAQRNSLLEVKEPPRPSVFFIVGKEGECIAKFHLSNIKEGYRYMNDRGGWSREYVPFEVINKIFRYLKTEIV